MLTTVTPEKTPAPHAASQRKKGAQPGRPANRKREVHPLLHRLYELYPRMFGPQFLPLKLGTFQELMAAHPGEFERDELKVALGIHTRSTRYLESVARGAKRHDLQGEPVGDLAPEHVHHAVVELFRRKQLRSEEDLQPAMRQRLRALFAASGLTRAQYAEQARVPLDLWSALLDQADLDQAEAIARREALLRAFEAANTTVDAFADSYGMDPATVTATLDVARQDRAIKKSRDPAPAAGPVLAAGPAAPATAADPVAADPVAAADPEPSADPAAAD